MNFNQLLTFGLEKNTLIFLGVIVFTLYLIQMSIVFWYTNKYQVKLKNWIFNLNFSYTAADIYLNLHHLPSILIKLKVKLDVIDTCFTILTGIFFSLLYYKILFSIPHLDSLNYIPIIFLLSSLCNLIENCILSIIFIRYPNKLFMLANIANYFTRGKLIFLQLGALGLLIVVYLWVRSTF